MTKPSRSKIELLFECPRCFWLYVGKNISRPSTAPYTINNAIDQLLKKEFDTHRAQGTAHYLIQQAGIDAVPYAHQDLDSWRHNFTGIQYRDLEHNFLIFGAVDDIWVNSQGELIVVDYKASGNAAGELYPSYKRQLEIYQWLLRQNGYTVHPRGYFICCRVDYAKGFAQGQLSFDIQLQPYDGDDSWLPTILDQARSLLDSEIPMPAENCSYCKYLGQVRPYEPLPAQSRLL
ncbi:MAG: hypothetical protein KatS3mg087_0407 [Patescibacteria group bacterium]|nr:MAG: hypothetical protein KatS3mg087_0407 [Patescibacteria group bacterium]